MLEVNQISKAFKNKEILHDVTCIFESGIVTGVLGQNGAGKTTLLRIIGQLLTPESGSILYNKRTLEQKNIGILLGGDVGLYQKLTARENIQYFADLHHLNPQIAKERMNRLSAKFSLESYMDQYAGELSRGTKQKVSIIRAMIHDPEVVLFDEPETGLDFDAAKAIADYLTQLANEGKTVIYSSHSIGNILAVCQNAYILHQGSVINYCSIEDLQHGCSSAEAQEKVYRIVTNSQSNKGDFEL